MRNILECLSCNDIIESTHRHDFVRCECGAVFTDGGRDYVRRGGKLELMNDLSIYEHYEDIDDEIYTAYLTILKNNEGDEQLAIAETAHSYDEEEDFIESIVDRFQSDNYKE